MLKQRCESLGLTVTDDGKQLVVNTPTGMRFLEDNTHELIQPYEWDRVDYGEKQKILAQMYSRVGNSTFVDCSDSCEWCYGDVEGA
jgi:hypothetical protein